MAPVRPPSVSDGSACKTPEPPVHRPTAVGSFAALGLCRWTQVNLSCSTWALPGAVSRLGPGGGAGWTAGSPAGSR